ncbi:unnamed protein product [Ceratitis capitata]|uniref:(Mediterranean fruit fly) hypothetical protein n=1 Tax=Ceratitis capitata TaxID=7213 RepID=A0A811US34_CERCA|nr:unnamed protein product [Ceratitis capitata]
MISDSAKSIRLEPLLYLILQLSVFFDYINGTPHSGLNEYMDTDRPYFDDINPRNVSTAADEPAILKCRVKNKGNRTE